LSDGFVESISDLPKRFLSAKCSCGLVFANGGCGHGMVLTGGREHLNETEVDYAVDIFVANQSAWPMVWRAKPACHTGGSDVVAGDCANPCRSH
jgi:hypothetical protein